MQNPAKKVVEPLVAAVNYTDGAVGMDKLNWYIAIVPNRSEKKSGETLAVRGFESYVAIQKEVRELKSGRKKTVDRIVFPTLVFVRSTEYDRLKKVAAFPFVKRFMSDPARRADPKSPAPAAVIPENQLETLRFMLENSPTTVEIDPVNIQEGDRVRVVSGGLSGLEGTVRRTVDGKQRLYVSLDILGCANVEIDKHFLQLA